MNRHQKIRQTLLAASLLLTLTIHAEKNRELADKNAALEEANSHDAIERTAGASASQIAAVSSSEQ